MDVSGFRILSVLGGRPSRLSRCGYRLEDSDDLGLKRIHDPLSKNGSTCRKPIWRC